MTRVIPSERRPSSLCQIRVDKISHVFLQKGLVIPLEFLQLVLRTRPNVHPCRDGQFRTWVINVFERFDCNIDAGVVLMCRKKRMGTMLLWIIKDGEFEGGCIPSPQNGQAGKYHSLLGPRTTCQAPYQHRFPWAVSRGMARPSHCTVCIPIDHDTE